MFHPTDLFHGVFSPAFFGTGTNLSLSSRGERDVGYLYQKPTQETQANKEVAEGARSCRTTCFEATGFLITCAHLRASLTGKELI
jgi:hypothetical protein